MTHQNHGHYAQKHKDNNKIDGKIAGSVKTYIKDGKIACAAAFKVAGELGVSPLEVGRAIDLLEIRVVKCQLGLFGHDKKGKIVGKAESLSPELDGAIKEKLVKGKLPCSDAWAIAESMGFKKMDVSSACETLEIKISPCQLGTF